MGEPSLGGDPYGDELERGFVQRGIRPSARHGRGFGAGGCGGGGRGLTLGRGRGGVSRRAAAGSSGSAVRWVATDGNSE